MKRLSEFPNSKEIPLSSQIPGYTPVLNALSTGSSTKKSIHKFFGTALKKNMNMLHTSIFSFMILNLVKKRILDFHVPTTTVGLCVKEVIDSFLRRAL